MNKVLAIKDHEGLCWNCLKTKKHIHKIHFNDLGYGSGFDMFETELHLCDDCYNEHPDYWDLNTIDVGEWGEKYDYEDEIFDFVSKMPIEGQQFFYNEFDRGTDARFMEPQDWIDYQLDILPFEKCKEYGLYAPEEINAYRSRFPKCQYPINRIFEDGSIGCWCPFGATGLQNQVADFNISSECYKCKYFKERKTPIENVLDKDWFKYEMETKLNALKEEKE